MMQMYNLSTHPIPHSPCKATHFAPEEKLSLRRSLSPFRPYNFAETNDLGFWASRSSAAGLSSQFRDPGRVVTALPAFSLDCEFSSSVLAGVESFQPFSFKIFSSVGCNFHFLLLPLRNGLLCRSRPLIDLFGG